jgi:hypothetical protein
MNRSLHKRYIDYREKHVYFGHPDGRQTPVLSPEAFTEADAEFRALTGKGKDRTAAEEKRFLALETLLFFD